MEENKPFCKKGSEVKSLSELNLPKDLEKIIYSCGLFAEDLIELVRKDKYLFSDEGDYVYEQLHDLALDSEKVTSDEYCELTDTPYEDIYRQIKQPLEEAGFFRKDDEFIAGDNIVNYILDNYGEGLFSIGFCWHELGAFTKNYEEHPAFTNEDFTNIRSDILGVYKEILPPEQYTVVEQDIMSGGNYEFSSEESELLDLAIENCSSGRLNGEFVGSIIRRIVQSY